MRTNRRHLRKTRRLSTGPAERFFLACLSNALRDDNWRAFIRERLGQQELPVIQLDDRRPR